MSNDLHLDELGGELDRVLRTATLTASQIGEHLARRSTNRAQAQAAAMRQGFLDRRDQARQIYLPLTYGKAADRATPQELLRGWQVATAWSGQDPEAARAAAQLADHLPAVPINAAATPGAATSLSKPPLAEPAQPGQAQPGQAQAERVTTADQAVQLAEQNAPGYYTRHDPGRREENAEQLVADWSHWQAEGQLPQRSIHEEWARHVGRGQEAAQAHQTGGEQGYDEALDRIWNSTSALTEQEARTLASEHAPAYYTRHDADALAVDPDTGQLRADWAHWREHGELPLTSRQEEWAAHVGRQQEFNPDQWQDPAERDAALQQVWDEGRDERGLLEMTDHLDQMDQVGLDTTSVVDSTLAADIEQFRLERDAARDTYTPLLDPAQFNAADQATAVAAWEQAAGWAGQDPAAQAAAAQLDQQFRTRWNTSPTDYLMDQISDQQADRTEIERAGQARTATDGSEREETGRVEPVEAGASTSEPAQRQQQFADAGRAAAQRDAVPQEISEAGDGAAAAIAETLDTDDQQAQPRYRRIDESDLSNADPEAIEARTISARSFSKPTAEMVENAAKQNRSSPVAKKFNHRGQNPSMDRGQTR